ncbi:MAG: polymer-forming cytoskeletal protein [Paracoccaceae bacterium]|nr:polymer-forming cytoskeletal protein [Paracoccaceae bacterium]
MFSDQKFTGSLLANSINLKGSISCKGELQIEGRINGNITGEKVVLGADSNMEGTLNADEVIISGKFKGKIKGKSIRLDSGSSVDAEINYEILAIEDGSTVNGTIRKLSITASPKKDTTIEKKEIDKSEIDSESR